MTGTDTYVPVFLKVCYDLINTLFDQNITFDIILFVLDVRNCFCPVSEIHVTSSVKRRLLMPVDVVN